MILMNGVPSSGRSTDALHLSLRRKMCLANVWPMQSHDPWRSGHASQ